MNSPRSSERIVHIACVRRPLPAESVIVDYTAEGLRTEAVEKMEQGVDPDVARSTS